MKNISIKNIFISLVLINIISILFLSGTIIFQSLASKKLVAAHEKRYQSYLLASEMRQSSDDLTRLGRTYVVTGDVNFKNQYMKILDIRNGKSPRPIGYNRIYWDFVADGVAEPRPSGAAVSLTDLMKQAGFSDEEFAQLQKAKANSDGLVGMEVEAMNLVEAKTSTPEQHQANREKAINMLHSPLYHHYKAQIMKPVDDFFILLESRTKAEVKVAQDLYNTAFVLCLLASGFVAVTVTFFAAFMSSRVLGGLSGLKSALNEIVQGQNPQTIPGMNRVDEIGEMAKAVVAFRDASLDRKRLEGEASITHLKNEQRLQELEANHERVTRNLVDVLHQMEAALGQLSGGVLTHRITTQFPPELEKLRHDFNGAAETLETLIQQVLDSAQIISAGSNDISNAADKIASRIEQQAEKVEKTTASVSLITSTVRKTAEGAEAARSVVGRAASDAAASRAIVERAVKAMSAIENSSREIGQIISVIDEIAFQTNLLALNAGVEAARAGDAGRGFAVVASEVRALAQRSAEAAREIKSLISTSTQGVEEGVKMVDQSGDALQRIADQVAEVNSIVEEISKATREQATTLHEVSATVTHIEQMTQKNAAMVEESNAASHELASEARTLASLTQNFKVSKLGSDRRGSSRFAA